MTNRRIITVKTVKPSVKLRDEMEESLYIKREKSKKINSDLFKMMKIITPALKVNIDNLESRCKELIEENYKRDIYFIDKLTQIMKNKNIPKY